MNQQPQQTGVFTIQDLFGLHSYLKSVTNPSEAITQSITDIETKISEFTQSLRTEIQPRKSGILQ